MSKEEAKPIVPSPDIHPRDRLIQTFYGQFNPVDNGDRQRYFNLFRDSQLPRQDDDFYKTPLTFRKEIVTGERGRREMVYFTDPDNHSYLTLGAITLTEALKFMRLYEDGRMRFIAPSLAETPEDIPPTATEAARQAGLASYRVITLSFDQMIALQNSLAQKLEE